MLPYQPPTISASFFIFFLFNDTAKFIMPSSCFKHISFMLFSELISQQIIWQIFGESWPDSY